MKLRANTSSRLSRSINSYFIENLGCAKNQVDAEIMDRALRDAGYRRTGEPEEADLIIINSCGFIESAKQESIETVIQLRNRCPESRIVMAGCLSQRYKEDLLRELPELDGVAGNGAPHRIPETVTGVSEGGPVVFFPERETPRLRRNSFFSSTNSVYVKIAEGCDNRCSYCAIPIIRGGLVSRTIPDIIDEVQRLLERGIFEFNLIAQDLGSFGRDRGKSELPDLLEKLSGLEGKFWVRLLYIHPDNFPPRLPELCLSDPRILPYFDLPFQHASKEILTRMNRAGSMEQYLDLIRRIRSTLPDAVLRSTFLVGFPGERGTDFAELLRFQERARFEWLGVFSYSREESTAAFSMQGRLKHLIAAPKSERRKKQIEARQLDIMSRQIDRFVGTELDVLVEERIAGEALVLGRAYFQAPEVDSMIVVHSGRAVPGDVLRCSLTRRNGIDFEAYPVYAETGSH